MEQVFSFAAASPAQGAPYTAVPAAGTTTVKATGGTLKSFNYSGTGSAGTIAVIDGSTTIFTIEVPAAVISGALALPPEGMLFGTSIKFTTAGTGITGLAQAV